MSSPSDLLIVVVDASAASWKALDTAALPDAQSALEAAVEAEVAAAEGLPAPAPPPPRPPRRCSFPEFVDHLNLFVGAYCSLGRRNDLAVLAYSERGGGYIWPRPGDRRATGDMLRRATVERAVQDRLSHLRYGVAVGRALEACSSRLELVDKIAALEIDDASAGAADRADGDDGGGVVARHDNLAACMSLGICYYNTARRLRSGGGGGGGGAGAAGGLGGSSGAFSGPGGGLRARMLVFAAGADRAAFYTPTVNAVFSAQRFGVPVDAVVLGERPSTVLQQAAELTRGVYSHPAPDAHALLFQTLVAAHLPDTATRELLLPPPPHAVDLRASCFCHRQHTDLAFVCSVCLSVWCAPKAACPVCGSDTSATKPAVTSGVAGSSGGAASGTGAGAGAGGGAASSASATASASAAAAASR